jgi:hypothetical protein
MEIPRWLTAALAAETVVYAIGEVFGWHGSVRGRMQRHRPLRQSGEPRVGRITPYRQPLASPNERARHLAAQLRSAQALAARQHIEQKQLIHELRGPAKDHRTANGTQHSWQQASRERTIRDRTIGG